MNVWASLEASRSAAGLARQVAAGEIAHAWLLLGPAGSGKRTTAVAIAASLNCSVEPGVGCGECSSCARIQRGRHPDVHHVIPEGPIIPVDIIREIIIPEASRSPFEGRFKVFIIEEADRMNESAQNALLKTLEEPQPDTVFVLVSDNEEEVLDTIRSRCRIVRLEPVSEGRILQLLVEAGVSDDRALLAARLSEGDFERAHALGTDQQVAERRDFWISLPKQLHSPLAALDAAAEIVDVARSVVKEREQTQKQEVVELAEAMGEGRGTATARSTLAKRHKRELRRLEEEVLGEALSSIASFYRDVLTVRSGGTEAASNIDLLNEIEWWASGGVEDRNLVSAMERCVEARAGLIRNANVVLAIEATLIELSALVPPPAGVGAGTQPA